VEETLDVLWGEAIAYDFVSVNAEHVLKNWETLTCCLGHEMKSILVTGVISFHGLTSGTSGLGCRHGVLPTLFDIPIHHRLLLSICHGCRLAFGGLLAFLTRFSLSTGRSIGKTLVVFSWLFLVWFFTILAVGRVLGTILILVSPAFFLRLLLVLCGILSAILFLILLVFFLALVLLFIILSGGLLRRGLLSPILGTPLSWSPTSLRHLEKRVDDLLVEVLSARNNF
jgi:hypothetical protein